MPKKDGPPQIDLRSICRDSDRHTVLVFLVSPYEESKTEWLHLGAASLEPHGNTRLQGRWDLTARMGAESPERGVPTDYDHDPIFACKLPLIGVEISAIRYHQPIARGFVDPTLDVTDRHNNFHVPASNYDPRKHSEAFQCERCAAIPVKDGGGLHTIVPSGFYVPKFDRALYEAVRGMEVEIRFYAPRTV